MALFKAAKVVATLPNPLTADTLYAMRTGVGFDLFISDNTGSVAHPLNHPLGVNGVPVYTQTTEPSPGVPYIWFQTDASGTVIDILKGQ